MIRLYKYDGSGEHTDFENSIFIKSNIQFDFPADKVSINSVDYRISSLGNSKGEKYQNHVFSNQVEVVTAGNPVRLIENIPYKGWMILKADMKNKGNMFLGNHEVDESKGFILEPGEGITISADELSKFYITSEDDGDKATLIGGYIG